MGIGDWGFKTTTAAKLAGKLKQKGRKPLLVACDIYRPAAIDQLEINAKKQEVEFFSMGTDVNPVKIAETAMDYAKEKGMNVVIFDTAGGVIFAKIINIFAKKKINPMIGAAGISAFPMSARVVHKLGLEEDPTNFLLTHTIGINVSGQIASVIAGGLILNLIAR